MDMWSNNEGYFQEFAHTFLRSWSANDLALNSEELILYLATFTCKGMGETDLTEHKHNTRASPVSRASAIKRRRGSQMLQKGCVYFSQRKTSSNPELSLRLLFQKHKRDTRTYFS
jgi:hypothetical protein